MEPSQQIFHLEEYKQLRVEVTGLVTRIEQLFRYSLIVAASVFAWLLTNSLGLSKEGEELKSCLKLPLELMLFGWSIPPLFIAGAGRLGYITSIRVTEMGEYLRRLEDALGVGTLGWEKFNAELATRLNPEAKKAWTAMMVIATLMSLIGSAIGASTEIACPNK